jgi:hypothetical protein
MAVTLKEMNASCEVCSAGNKSAESFFLTADKIPAGLTGGKTPAVNVTQMISRATSRPSVV